MKYQLVHRYQDSQWEAIEGEIFDSKRKAENAMAWGMVRAVETKE